VLFFLSLLCVLIIGGRDLMDETLPSPGLRTGRFFFLFLSCGTVGHCCCDFLASWGGRDLLVLRARWALRPHLMMTIRPKSLGYSVCSTSTLSAAGFLFFAGTGKRAGSAVVRRWG
jgi:hypothetical protein